jgi:hypothetical protein
MKPTQTHQSYESKEGIYIRTACVNLGTLPFSIVIQFYAILHWSNSWNTFDGFESWHQCSLPNLPGHIKSRHITREVLRFRQSNRGQNAMRNEHDMHGPFGNISAHKQHWYSWHITPTLHGVHVSWTRRSRWPTAAQQNLRTHKMTPPVFIQDRTPQIKQREKKWSNSVWLKGERGGLFNACCGVRLRTTNWF